MSATKATTEGNRGSVRMDEFDLTAAIWILSSLDENPIMTYRGVVDRIGSSEVAVKEIVHRRRELFRTGVPNYRMHAWKADMRNGTRIPNWVRDQPDQAEAIKRLSADDVFRNQFRVEDRAKKSDLEIIEWGLQHIERSRKADTEHKQESKARWTLWLSGVSVAVALCTALATTFLQARSIDAQTQMKVFETEFKPKQEGYYAFIAAVAEAGILALKRDGKVFEKTDDVQTRFYALEPFLTPQARKEIFDGMQDFISFCTGQIEVPPAVGAEKPGAAVKYTNMKNDLRDKLYTALFRSPSTIR